MKNHLLWYPGYNRITPASIIPNLRPKFWQYLKSDRFVLLARKGNP
ncbi:MAG: hypothetical protein JXB29_02925 [Sedimentisphaerales bacterium]|nr:hypothetical protein [Sedimentisphaerales bacterium]